MTGAAARAIMSLAVALIREQERPWVWAMQIEFDEAERDGHVLSFAMGCVTAAMRRLACSSAGWHFLTRYAFSLGVLLPLTLFHVSCAGRGLYYQLVATDPYLATLAAGDARQRAIATAYQTLSPVIILLLAALGAVHLLIAWRIVACEWRRVWHAMLAAVGIVAGLFVCIMAIQPTPGGMMLQGTALAAELLAVPILVAWHARRPPAPTL